MGDSAVPDGRLVFWTPTASAPAWADDPRAPALVHEDHVRAAASRGARCVDPAWIGVSFGVGRVGPRQVGSALSAWLRGHEHLRSRLVTYGERCARRTLPASAVTLRREDVGVFADGRAVRRQIEAFFDRGTGPLGWPQVVFATVEGVAGVTVFAGADHGVVDAYTLAMIPGEVRDVLRGEGAVTRGPTFLDVGAEERVLTDRAPAGPEHADHWRSLLRRAHGRTPAFPLPLGASEEPLPQRSAYHRLLDGPAAARFAAASGAAGGTTASGLLACLALAAAKVAGERQLSVISLANTRLDHWRAVPGWLVGLHPVRIPTAPGAAFADTVALATAELRRRGPGPGSSLPHINRLLRREIRPRFVVSYLDVRRVAGTPPRPDDVMLRSRVHGRPAVYLWLTRGERGVHLSARFPDTAVARTNVERFVTAAARAAARVADAHRAGAVPASA
ncbi:hypothetical protein [Streptomyces albireticuli]|uniref:Condensation domain-containing protein n=1 Tax=Streptomyces albireticuli TaxID=1940 RepID=A0A2A2DCZ1_9ACTN|nr:hypothetical protein [Streptomyces albireticuli]MCD9144924.1 hypothetical protein [Streptomyces albireticuli]MCD9164350.1 hypothetical protein [Streptomyces albireticuli]MCD9194061.1 hypothetical protein [Streptomyces albireticuli]PAU49307.1 hypothetical protein CK936_08525 [Streptomyces albireticuli]